MTSPKAKERVAGPVIRLGQLVRPSVDGEPLLLDDKKANRALDLLEQAAPDIDRAVQESVCAEFDGQAKFLGAAPGVLRQATRSRALGPVFDFSEMKLQLDNFLFDLGFSVTVCVAPKNVDGQFERSQSKFWVRLRVDRWPHSIASGSLSDNTKLAKLSERITKASFAAIREPYRKIISEAAGRPVTIDLAQLIEVFIVNASEAEAFDDLFSDSQAGTSFVNSALKDNNAARDLLQTMVAVMPQSSEAALATTPESQLEKLGKLNYFCFEDIAGFRGVVVAKIDDDRVNLVGLAKGPRREESAQATQGKQGSRRGAALENPANRVSAGIIVELASRF